MMLPQRSRQIVIALYVNAALLLAVLVAMMTRGSMPDILPASAMGQVQAPIAGGAGVFLMPGQFAEKTWGCYLLDVDSQTLCAYQYFPGEKQLRLIAARNYRYDRKLGNFNTDHPTPQEVKELLDKEASSPRAVEGPGGTP